MEILKDKKLLVGGLAVIGGIALVSYLLKSKAPRRNSEGFFNALGSDANSKSIAQSADGKKKAEIRRAINRRANLVRSEINAVNNQYSYEKRVGALRNALSLIQEIYLILSFWEMNNQGITADYLLLTVGKDNLRLVCPQMGVAQQFISPTSYLGLFRHISNLASMQRATITEQFPDGGTLTPSQIPAQNQIDQQFLSLFNSWINRTNV